MKNATVSNVITHRSRAIRICLIIAGIFFVGIGTLGIVLPLLPTTPFLVLAAMCFSRSSEKFHNWLLSNKWFGAYIKNYREGNGILLRQKVVVLSLLILTIGYSCIFLLNHIAVRIILLLVAIGISIHIIRIPSLRNTQKTASSEEVIKNSAR